MSDQPEHPFPNLSAYLHKAYRQTLDGQQPAAPAASPPPVSVAPLAPAASASAEKPVWSAASFWQSCTLGGWAYYFLAKLGLFAMAVIDFHVAVNLLFAALLVSPAPQPLWRKFKPVLMGVSGVALLYYDSWLPPLGRLFAQLGALGSFSLTYWFELLARIWHWPTVALLLLGWLMYRRLAQRIRIDVLLVLAMLLLGGYRGLVAPLLMRHDAPVVNMEQVLQDFFKDEAQRSVVFNPAQSYEVPFDVIFLHVCSLSWADVRAAGLESHPLWQRFDILFENFNSAASYSGPAAIHLLRATCGQPEHAQMYAPVAEKCYLMNNLLRSGFEPTLALNHDGKFDDFLGQVQMQGRITVAPLALDGLNVVQHAFDQSPIYDDLAVLNRWLELRQQSSSARVALYYNTVSLHDGNRLLDGSGGQGSLLTYKTRLSKLLDNMEAFMQKVETSGRRAVVVVVPEHGAAIGGDKQQIAGLREIPNPSITLVPVGIKLIGANVHREGEAVRIESPTSYLAISHLVARMLESSPFDRSSFSLDRYLADLPLTPYVAQNEKVTVAEHDHHYYLRRENGAWESYAEFDQHSE